jgi:tripartite ATP-independent transporter DctP family solute receptor
MTILQYQTIISLIRSFLMKKLFSALLLAGVLMVFGCSKGSDDGTITLKLGHHLTEQDSNNYLATKFKEYLEEATAGKVKVDIYPNGQLGGQLELLESLKLGSIDMSISDTGLLANYEKSIGILDMPYVFDGVEHAKKVLSSEIGDALKAKVTATSGIRPLTLEAVAVRDTFLKDKMVKTLADMKGVKVRTPNAPSIIATFNALGANPTAIPSGEAYTAIQTDVVDGMEGNPEFLSSIKIYEVAHNWFETEHIMTCTALNISDKVYNGLPADVQAAIDESAKKALVDFYAFSAKATAEKRKFLEEAGVKFYPVEKDDFVKAVEPMVKKFVVENNIVDIYESIEAAK